ncbi:unnamed protein product, partial [Tilletia controversa]
LSLAKSKPEELGSNGKHLLNATNKKGTQAVTTVINEKASQMRFDMRERIHISIEETQNLQELIRAVLEGVEQIKPTWEFVQRIAIWDLGE